MVFDFDFLKKRRLSAGVACPSIGTLNLFIFKES